MQPKNNTFIFDENNINSRIPIVLLFLFEKTDELSTIIRNIALRIMRSKASIDVIIHTQYDKRITKLYMINSKKTQVAPSLLSANFGNLEKDIEMLNQSEADFIHLDIMDGVFVPNISFGFPVLEYVNRLSKKSLDAHLMVVDPGRFVNEVKKIGAEIMTVHYEACTHLDRTIHQIKEAGMKAGVSLNPHTPVSLLENIINDIDLVLIMSVNPGYGNQKFIPYSLDKVKSLRELINRKGAATLIEVDGGVNLETGKLLIDAGADILVAGSFVFNSSNPTATISALSKL